MAKTEAEVRELLARFVGSNRPTMLGTVKYVDKTENTCTVDDDGVEWLGVRLRSITGENNGIVAYPKQGAYVLCVQVEDTEEWAVIKATEYESIEMTIESLVINSGDNGGLVKIDAMISWMQKVKTDLTTISTAMKGLGVPVVITTDQPVKSDFEDTKIKH